jgi:hypothetical protein
MKVYDVKPRGGFVTDIKPTMGRILNVLPRLSKVYGEEYVFRQMYRGMPIGLLLTLTYPETYRT